MSWLLKGCAVLAILVLYSRNAEADTILTSPRVTTWGTWSAWESCPEGTLGVGFRLKTQKSKGFRKDDTALNAIDIFCGVPGTGKYLKVLSGIPGEKGKWGQKRYCASGSYMIGFQLRSELPQGALPDDSAANNLAIICGSNSTRRIETIHGDGLTNGEWTASQECGEDMAICGMRTQVDLEHSKDMTGLNNVDMKCCSLKPKVVEAPAVQTLSCVPFEAWEDAAICNNERNAVAITCGFQKVLGVRLSAEGNVSRALTNVESGAESPELAAMFKNRLGLNGISGHDWAKESSGTWKKETKTGSQFQGRPSANTVLQQLVGFCGDVQVRTEKFRTVDVHSPV